MVGHIYFDVPYWQLGKSQNRYLEKTCRRADKSQSRLTAKSTTSLDNSITRTTKHDLFTECLILDLVSSKRVFSHGCVKIS